MKRRIPPFFILFSTIMLVSCLGDDDSDITYYTDTAITSFSLGTLNRTMYTLSSEGEDSSYTVTVTGSDYKFYIDQAGRKIYNPDSLPVGTDAEHVICYVSSKNAGIVAIKDIDSDTLRYYSSSDSVDFSSPREFWIYSTDGTACRIYDVRVNVHKEDPDSFMWNNNGSVAAFTSMQGMKAVAFGGKVLVYGLTGSSTSVYFTDKDDGKTWTEGQTNVRLDAKAYMSVTVKDDALFTVSGGSLLVSSDGLNWENGVPDEASGTAMPDRLIGAGSVKLYAIDSDGDIVSSADQGVTWTKDEYVTDKSEIPVDDIGLGSFMLSTNTDTERIIIAGNRDLTAYPEDSVAMVWCKIEEYAENSERHRWTLCNEDNGFQLPRMSNLNMTVYGKVLIAVGGSGLGTSMAEAFSQIYVSEDSGLTWQDDGRHVLPEDFTNNGSDVFAITADEDNCLWIICGGNGDVWRGRLNELGWAEYQTSFSE